MAENPGKFRALLGVLIVFIIPFILITIIYKSPKPEVKHLPELTDTPILFNAKALNDTSVIKYYHEDIKVIVPNIESSVDLITDLIAKTKNYPKRTFKDRHSNILFIYPLSTKQKNLSGYYISNEEFNKIYSQTELNNDNILLLDQENVVRGYYSIEPISIRKLDTDIQHLMIETLSENSQNDRIFK